MVNLLCAIVGAASNAFEVNIDDTASVAALKKAVKAEKPNDMKGIDADKLELFLAKTNGGAWLDRAGAASVALDGRGDPRGYVQMDPTLWIKNPMYFGDNFRPAEGQIHVLVVVPSHVRAGIGVNPSKLLRYKRCRRWIVIALFISLLISFIVSGIVVSYGQNPTDEKGCLAADVPRFVCYLAGVFMTLLAFQVLLNLCKTTLDEYIDAASDQTSYQAI